MSSTDYIPLTQISPSEFTSGQHPHQVSFGSCFSRRRALLVLVAATSLVALVVFAPFHEDEPEYPQVLIIPAYQPSYIAVPVPDELPLAARPKIQLVRELPTHCLEQYYENGLPCHDGKGPIPIDVVWTWTNGSDPNFLAAKDSAADSYDENDPYRPLKTNNPSRMDHDELRHSIRSVLENFRPYTNRFHVLTSDLDYAEQQANLSLPYPGPGRWRLGLHPQWLDTAQNDSLEWRDGDVQLSLTHHAHFFEPYNHSIFNSYAIETQFSHLQNISETFIYMNDDFFVTLPLTPYSFYTHQYGHVMRIQKDMSVGPDLPKSNDKGEWRSMSLSNWLLSAYYVFSLCKRFGRRRRPYIQHQAKAVSFAIVQELALMWPSWLAQTASHAFRETEGGDGDFYHMFVFAHFLVERAREALLWSWTVGRVGGLDDSWDEDVARRAWVELGGAWEDDGSAEIHVESGMRATLNEDRIKYYLKDGGIEGDFRTHYQFSSLDGYAYNDYGRRGEGGWPTFGIEELPHLEWPTEKDAWERERDQRKCTIKRDECFGFRLSDGEPPKASEIFKQIAFGNTKCGDCVIVALVNKSGPLGLSAFLPHRDRRSPRSEASASDESETIPHLPLIEDWHDGQFSLSEVMKYASEASVREWSMRLLQRYRYVIGGTQSAFERLGFPQQVRNMLENLDRTENLALLCVNDDITQESEQVDSLFRQWQDKRWKRPAAWESDSPNNRY
ncbi:hypothetical protein C8Q80DRAFT_1273944 [Daedaleopsis nitida]|nr:hypothetical protein C8Q80DRAFT_1273944 [Daedaleopsis nitida]